jgi:hypothetical protein
MRHRISQLRPSLLALGLGLLTAGPIRAQPSPNAPLAGLWKFNADLSDHMEDKLANARRPGAYTGMAGGGRRPGGRGTRGEGGGRLGEDQEMGRLLFPILQILIRQDDSTVAISDAAGQMQTFYTDGRKIKEPQLTGADLQISAKWKDGKLTIERKQDKGNTLRETYDFDPASKQMVLSVKLSSPSLPRALEFRRVYDPATGG